MVDLAHARVWTVVVRLDESELHVCVGIPNAICYSLRLAPGWFSIFLVYKNRYSYTRGITDNQYNKHLTHEYTRRYILKLHTLSSATAGKPWILYLYGKYLLSAVKLSFAEHEGFHADTWTVIQVQMWKHDSLLPSTGSPLCKQVHRQ